MLKIRFIFKKLKEREEKHRNCQSFEKIREKIFLIFNELGNYTLQQINRRFSAHPFYGGLSFFSLWIPIIKTITYGLKINDEII